MNSTSSQLPPDLLSPQPEPEPMALTARMLNVIAAPGDVLDYLVAAKSSAANWVVPLILATLLSWIGTTLVFSQPWALQQLTEMQEKGMQEQLKKQGMSNEQIEAAKEKALPITTMITRIGAYAAPPFVALGGCFIWGLFLWLVGNKACGASFPFMKAVEVVGLTLVIDTLGAVVKTLLILVTGNLISGPSPVLLLHPFEPTNPVHGFLAQLDIFTLWSLVVAAMGLARLAKRPFATAALWVLGAWILVRGGLMGLAFLAQSFTGR